MIVQTRPNHSGVSQEEPCGYHVHVVVGRVDNDYQALCLACGVRGPLCKSWEEASRALELAPTNPPPNA